MTYDELIEQTMKNDEMRQKLLENTCVAIESTINKRCASSTVKFDNNMFIIYFNDDESRRILLYPEKTEDGKLHIMFTVDEECIKMDITQSGVDLENMLGFYSGIAALFRKNDIPSYINFTVSDFYIKTNLLLTENIQINERVIDMLKEKIQHI